MKSQNKVSLEMKIFWGDYPHLRPPGGGSRVPPPKKILDYENIIIKHCPCQFSAS